ncbi:MAG TPA: hypothetical protein VFW84_08795 [Aquabacterium sp.]|nr:hypothetical protein [Aquabacterium sp.]HET6786777.1 hypothetical protein [Aquabacterium sp.]HEX5372820.1 hypothetical protein [Aquabacterium sp.]
MRPLFAIAPLAAFLALMGPSTQPSPESSWTDTAMTWVMEQAHALMD